MRENQEKIKKSISEIINTFIYEHSGEIIKIIYALIILSCTCISVQTIIPALLAVYFIGIYKGKYKYPLAGICSILTVGLMVYLKSQCMLIQIPGFIFAVALAAVGKLKKDYSSKIWALFLALYVFGVMEISQYRPINILNLFCVQWIDIKLLLLCSFFIICGTMSCISFLFGKKVGSILVADIMFLLGLINFFVMTFTGSAFIFSDIKLAKTAFGVAGTYRLKWNELLVLLLVIILIILYHIIVLKIMPQNLIDRKKMLSGFLAGIIFVSFFYAIFVSDSSLEVLNYKTSEKYSTLVGFLVSMRPDMTEPKNYDTYKDYEPETKETISPDTKPNVIVIMSEAFSDLTVNGNFETSEDVIPNTREIMKESISGYLYSSVWGNNTVSSEFEFLTGIPTAFTTKGANVYQNYLHDAYPSIAKVFNSIGYKTYGVHPYYGNGYNRDNAWKALGFENESFLEDFENSEKIRDYISDKANFKRIIEIEQSSEEPVFIFDVTMQNHAAYLDDTGLEDKVAAEKKVESDNLNNYLTLVHESDKAIKELVDYYTNSDEPTVIVFFGDHQPSVAEFYKKLFGTTEENFTTEEVASQHKIPYFIWANYDMDETNVPEEMSINYLPGVLLNKLGISDTWFDFTMNTIKKYPIISMEIYKTDKICRKDEWKEYIGSITPGEETGDELQLKRYESLAYKYVEMGKK